jgi:hypothetical protein
VLLAPAGALGRYGTRVGHELRRGSETMQVTGFGNDADRTQKANASKCLQA